VEPTSSNANSLTNGGALEAMNGGTLSIMSNVTNSGTFEAFDASSVTMQSGDLLANDSAGVLTGGAYNAVSAGDGATVTLGGGRRKSNRGQYRSRTKWLRLGGCSLTAHRSKTLSQQTTGRCSFSATATTLARTALRAAARFSLAAGIFRGPRRSQTTPRVKSTGLAPSTRWPRMPASSVPPAGVLTLGNGIQGAGTVQIDAGAGLDLSGGGASSSANYLINNGSNLNLGGEQHCRRGLTTPTRISA
jgi:hypothetical protein